MNEESGWTGDYYWEDIPFDDEDLTFLEGTYVVTVSTQGAGEGKDGTTILSLRNGSLHDNI